jgi:hypothetical protein
LTNLLALIDLIAIAGIGLEIWGFVWMLSYYKNVPWSTVEELIKTRKDPKDAELWEGKGKKIPVLFSPIR